MSFGYYDKDWVDPPEETTEADTREAVIEFTPNDIIRIEDGSIVEFPEFEPWYDPQNDIEILDPYALDDIVSDLMDEYFPMNGKDYADGTYRISGEVFVPYTVWIPLRRDHYPSWYEDEIDDTIEFELDGKPKAHNVEFIRID